jgi:uncharacterized membrane protein
MSKFVVIVFPGETQAYQGTHALKELHAEGSLTLYGMAVIAKDAKGNLSIKEAVDVGPLSAAVGALVGGFIGLLAGPAGALAGAMEGTLIGSLTDLFHYGVGADFLDTVSNELAPSKFAIVAEIAEDWTTPLDTRMEALGGTVLRTWRADFEDEQIAKDTAALDVDFEQLKQEYAQASAETKAKLKGKLDQAKTNLAQAQQRLKTRLDAVQQEANAKVAALEQQMTSARADAKEAIRKRITALRVDHETRSAKLKQAWDLTKEALAP